MARSESGSFRDRHGRVFYKGDSVYRTLSGQALAEWLKLSEKPFFKRLSDQEKIIPTRLMEGRPPLEESDGRSWAGWLKHKRLPFVSYPYEWSFSMLRDAALLQLEVIEEALGDGMTLKDATSYNLQWFEGRPIFIDTGSFETLRAGEPWLGYRQFCQLFLYPLLLQAYRGLDFQPWLRGSLEGISAAQCNAVMSRRDRLRKGVLTHVYLQDRLQKRFEDSQRNTRDSIKRSGFDVKMILHNVRALRRLIGHLSWTPPTTVWTEYAGAHSYSEDDHEAKKVFVERAVARRRRKMVWDLGCNTGDFSRIAAAHADCVVSFDADHPSIERFYHSLKERTASNILPLLSNLADPSPGLGWRGRERKPAIERGRPEITLCLALVHHLVIGANIPLAELVDWLRSLNSEVVIEFVDKSDPMVETLLRNKEDQYDDYQFENFEKVLRNVFEVSESIRLSNGSRSLHHAVPRS